MTGTHPDELALLAYVEEEPRDPAVAAHVTACPACTEQVRLLEAGRDALRSAQLLELPEERRARILASLPPRRDPWAALAPFKRVLVVAGPVAAVAALVVVFVAVGNLGGGDDEEGAAPAEATMQDAGAAPEAESAEGGGTELLREAPLRKVRGPAREIARELRAQGFAARLEKDSVVVTGANPAEVELALRDRPAGAVAVFVR
jgi:hypothetical protein